jgi:hypothetical protein
MLSFYEIRGNPRQAAAILACQQYSLGGHHYCGLLSNRLKAAVNYSSSDQN